MERCRLARDPLAILWRLRDAAVTEASAALASARESTRQLSERLDSHNAQTRQEQTQAQSMDGAAFSAWLPQARKRATSLQNQLSSEEARSHRLLQALTERRTEAEAVAKALERQRKVAGTLAARHEQQAMDEAAGNNYRVNIRR
jgi:flagellar export protein FliJ